MKRRAGMVLAAFVLSTAACQKPLGPRLAGKTYTFTVAFDAGGCPTKAPASDPNCETPVLRQDCVKVEQKKDNKVKVVAEKPTDPTFDIAVQPSGLAFVPEGALGSEKSKYDARIEAAAPGQYKFSVSAGKCTPLDPTIIIN